MILYHFTLPAHVPSILREGLVPNHSVDLGLGRQAVWLTVKPTRDVSPRQKEILLERGTDETWLPDSTVRLTVRLSSTDRRLKRYIPWLKKQTFEGRLDASDELIQLTMQHWWVYFGTIAPKHIIVAK